MNTLSVISVAGKRHRNTHIFIVAHLFYCHRFDVGKKEGEGNSTLLRMRHWNWSDDSVSHCAINVLSNVNVLTNIFRSRKCKSTSTEHPSLHYWQQDENSRDGILMTT